MFFSDSSDTSLKFELNNEIESLNKEISDYKRSVLSQNANILKELEEIENLRVLQLKKLVYAYGRGSLTSHNRIQEAIEGLDPKFRALIEQAMKD